MIKTLLVPMTAMLLDLMVECNCYWSRTVASTVAVSVAGIGHAWPALPAQNQAHTCA